MRENYKGNKKRKEEARRKKQEEKRNRRLNKSRGAEEPQTAETGQGPLPEVPLV